MVNDPTSAPTLPPLTPLQSAATTTTRYLATLVLLVLVPLSILAAWYYFKVNYYQYHFKIIITIIIVIKQYRDITSNSISDIATNDSIISIKSSSHSSDDNDLHHNDDIYSDYRASILNYDIITERQHFSNNLSNLAISRLLCDTTSGSADVTLRSFTSSGISISNDTSVNTIASLSAYATTTACSNNGTCRVKSHTNRRVRSLPNRRFRSLPNRSVRLIATGRHRLIRSYLRVNKQLTIL